MVMSPSNRFWLGALTSATKRSTDCIWNAILKLKSRGRCTWLQMFCANHIYICSVKYKSRNTPNLGIKKFSFASMNGDIPHTACEKGWRVLTNLNVRGWWTRDCRSVILCSDAIYHNRPTSTTAVMLWLTNLTKDFDETRKNNLTFRETWTMARKFGMMVARVHRQLLYPWPSNRHHLFIEGCAI